MLAFSERFTGGSGHGLVVGSVHLVVSLLFLRARGDVLLPAATAIHQPQCCPCNCVICLIRICDGVMWCDVQVFMSLLPVPQPCPEADTGAPVIICCNSRTRIHVLILAGMQAECCQRQRGRPSRRRNRDLLNSSLRLGQHSRPVCCCRPVSAGYTQYRCWGRGMQNVKHMACSCGCKVPTGQRVA